MWIYVWGYKLTAELDERSQRAREVKYKAGHVMTRLQRLDPELRAEWKWIKVSKRKEEKKKKVVVSLQGKSQNCMLVYWSTREGILLCVSLKPLHTTAGHPTPATTWAWGFVWLQLYSTNHGFGPELERALDSTAAMMENGDRQYWMNDGFFYDLENTNMDKVAVRAMYKTSKTDVCCLK